MKVFLQILVLSMIMGFSAQTAYAAKANHDKSKTGIQNAVTKVKGKKQKVKNAGDRGLVHSDIRENSVSAKNKVKAMNLDRSKSNLSTSKTAKPVLDPTKAQDWNSSRSNKTSKTSIKILSKDTKQAKDDDNN